MMLTQSDRRGLACHYYAKNKTVICFTQQSGNIEAKDKDIRSVS